MSDINPDRPAIRRRPRGTQEPKPCPTCYTPMTARRSLDHKGRLIPDNPTTWECARHGEPTRP